MRHLRVVAGAMLIIVLATVAVPGPAGSRVPSPPAAVDPVLFQPVEVTARSRGATTTTTPPAPDAGTTGTGDEPSATVEATRPSESKAAPLRAAQAPVTVVPASDAWRDDDEVSWFGPGFYGRRTACGLALTKALVGVAHRSLPCGTLVAFRNPEDGRVVIAPVVDRGPYVDDRQWDLTGGACVALDHCYTGPLEYQLLDG